MAEQVRIPGLDEVRRQIDEVDTELLALLNRRAALSLAAGELKARSAGAQVFDAARETALLDSLSARNPGPLTTSHIVSIWRSILSASRAVQKPCSVAYLGPEGTFSYFAASDYLGSSMTFVPCGG
ncbi:MAG: chorismate mutase, partial [Mailhella sp.]|nr:chorismate mutase [Mailhella sp.]